MLEIKKVLLIGFIVFCIIQIVVMAAAIDIGNTASDRPHDFAENYTHVDGVNPANGTGTITTIKIWAKNAMAGCKVGIFTADGNNMTATDSETIQIGGEDPGVVPAGSEQTATVDLTVTEGQYLGLYCLTGTIELDDENVVGDGMWYKAGDQMSCTAEAFSNQPLYIASFNGTGATAEEEGTTIMFTFSDF